MTFTNCAATVERTLTRKDSGIKSADVNFAAEAVNVVYDPVLADFDIMVAAGVLTGFTGCRCISGICTSFSLQVLPALYLNMKKCMD